MNALRPTIDAPTARQKFEATRWRHLHRWFASPTSTHPARFELVYLPHYLVTFQFHQDNKRRTATLLIGGHEPTVSLVDSHALPWSDAAPTETFQPRLNHTQATELAQREIVRLLLAKPGFRSPPATGQSAHTDLVYYPFWAYYFRRRAGMLDVRLLDAVTGSAAGPKAKVALLAALADARHA